MSFRLFSFVLLLSVLACSFVGAQVSITENYEECRLFAVSGIGVDTNINWNQAFSQCADVSFLPGVWHNGYLVHTDAERASVLGEIQALYKGNEFVTYGPIVVPIWYCGQTSSLNITVTASPWFDVNPETATGAFAFFEISQVNNKPVLLPSEGVVNFYTDYYLAKGSKPSWFYVSTISETPCDIVESCFNQFGIPIFYKSPDGGTTYSYFIRTSLSIYEVVCGAVL